MHLSKISLLLKTKINPEEVLHLSYLTRVSHKQVILPTATTTSKKYFTPVLPLNMRVTHPGQSLICPCILTIAYITVSLPVVSKLHGIVNITAVLSAVCYTLQCRFPVSGSYNRSEKPLLDNQ